jgi:hypothetical protein
LRKKNLKVTRLNDLVGDEMQEKSTATERNGDLSLAAQTLDAAKTVGDKPGGRPRQFNGKPMRALE